MLLFGPCVSPHHSHARAAAVRSIAMCCCSVSSACCYVLFGPSAYVLLCEPPCCCWSVCLQPPSQPHARATSHQQPPQEQQQPTLVQQHPMVALVNGGRVRVLANDGCDTDAEDSLLAAAALARRWTWPSRSSCPGRRGARCRGSRAARGCWWCLAHATCSWCRATSAGTAAHGTRADVGAG